MIANIAGHNASEFIEMAKLRRACRTGGVELNISCPNVSAGPTLGRSPQDARDRQGVRDVCPLPIIAKLTPNVTDIREIAWGRSTAGRTR